MELIAISEQDNQKLAYNHFVQNAESGSFLQSWEWGEWQSALGRQVFRYWMLDTSREPIASIQLIKMPLPLGKYYLYAPYGPVLDLRFKIEDLRFLQQELKKKFIECIFVRIEQKLWNIKAESWDIKKTQNIQPSKTFIINLSKTEDGLLADMHTKTRYNIRLAQKHGVEIYPIKSGEAGQPSAEFNRVKDEFEISIGNGLFAKEAVELIVQTSQRQGYKGYGKEYYRTMVDFFTKVNNQNSPPPNLPPQGGGRGITPHIYKAVYKNQLLASAIMLDFGGTRTFLFGGSSENHKNLMAPYLMHYRAMLDAKKLGLNFYDFWGIETSKGETPGFVRFKLGFGSQEGIVEYPGAKDVIFSQFGYRIYTIFRKIKRIFKF